MTESTPAEPSSANGRNPRSRGIELLISNLLRGGVALSLLLIAAGTVVSFVRHREYLSNPPALARLTSPGAAFPHTVRDVASGLKEGRGRAIVTVGLMLLIATPVMRVAVSILAFALEGDRRYVVITTIVLALLVLSFALGKVER